MPAPPSTGGVAGVVILSLFLYLSYSRVADLFLVGLHIPLVVSLVGLLIAFTSGGIARTLSSRITFWLAAYSAWIVAAVPFSFWRGGSFQLLTDQWIKSFAVFFVVAGLLRTVDHCRKAMYALGWAAATVVILALALGTTSGEGRLMFNRGVFANSNDLAQMLVLCLPFVMLLALAPGSRLRRATAAAAAVALLAVVGRTGSRAAIVTLAALAVILLLRTAWSTRLKIVAGALALFIVVLPFIPSDQRARYATILGDETDAPREAVDSTESRIELLKQSIALTLMNPLFGVGPGVFEPASAAYSERRGERAIWRVTHNSYTQVSSETGLPGLLFYVGTLLTCLLTARKIYRDSHTYAGPEPLPLMSFSLWLAFVAYLISTLFSSVAYHMYVPTFAGLALGLQQAVASATMRGTQQTAPADGPLARSGRTAPFGRARSAIRA